MFAKSSLTAVLIVAAVSLPLTTALADGYRFKPRASFVGAGVSTGLGVTIGNRGSIRYGFYYHDGGRLHFRPYHASGYRQYRYYNQRGYHGPSSHYSGLDYRFRPPAFRDQRFYRHHKPRHGYYGDFKPRRYHHRHYFKPHRHQRHYGYHYYKRRR